MTVRCAAAPRRGRGSHGARWRLLTSPASPSWCKPVTRTRTWPPTLRSHFLPASQAFGFAVRYESETSSWVECLVAHLAQERSRPPEMARPEPDARHALLPRPVKEGGGLHGQKRGSLPRVKQLVIGAIPRRSDSDPRSRRRHNRAPLILRKASGPPLREALGLRACDPQRPAAACPDASSQLIVPAPRPGCASERVHRPARDPSRSAP
jgi:hypothetical protein